MNYCCIYVCGKLDSLYKFSIDIYRSAIGKSPYLHSIVILLNEPIIIYADGYGYLDIYRKIVARDPAY